MSLFDALFGAGSFNLLFGGDHVQHWQPDQTRAGDRDDGADPGAGGPAPRAASLFAGIDAASGPDLTTPLAIAGQNAFARLVQAQQAQLQLDPLYYLSGMGLFQFQGGNLKAVSSWWVAASPHEATDLKTEAIVAGEILAWRVWRLKVGSAVQAPQLMSVACAYRWAPGMIAEGDPASGYGVHAFKDKDRMLNLYRVHAYKDKDRMLNLCGGASVFGEVSLWGDVIEHEHGYRASHAKIKSLALVRFASAKDVEIERNLRSHYGVGAPSA